jgi:signal transduction histidine kinase
VTRPRPGLRRHAVRTALTASGLVALVMLALCAGIDLVVAHNLRASAEERLNRELMILAKEPSTLPVREPDFDDPVVSWRLDEQGRVIAASAEAPALPAAARGATTPRALTIAGTEFLVASAPVPSGRLVLAESLSSTGRAITTVIAAEAAVVAVLLALVFMSALLVARRVAGPIERARQRQLDFTADASHELRTPLSVIEAETSLALSESGAPSSDRQALARVLDESRRLRRIVDDLLWLARFDALPEEPATQDVDVATTATVVAQRFEGVARSRGLRIGLEAAQDGSAIISAPPEWLDRLCGVLVDNACRYTPPGGSVSVAVRREGSRVRLSVDDTGPGISAQDRHRMFDRFHRGAGDGEGAGLGLAIGEAIVRATHGRWMVANRSGGGASIGVIWPAGATSRAGSRPGEA